MSQNRNTNVTQTFIVEGLDGDYGFSACTGVYTNYLAACVDDIIYVGSSIISNDNITGISIYGTTFYSGGTNLSDIINDSSVYLTGGTYSNGTLTLINNNSSNIFVDGFDYLDMPFNTHTGDTSIHYTKSSISLSEIGNSAHTHSISNIINLQNILDSKTNNINFNTHTGDTSIHYTKSSINLSDLGSSAHTHSISNIINLQSTLDSKFNLSGGTINGNVTANYFYGDGSGLTNVSKRHEDTLTTTDNSLVTISTITGLTLNTSRFIEIYVTANSDINNYGFWKRTIGVMNVGGSTSVIIENYDTDKQSSGLNPTDVSFVMSGSDVLVKIKGEVSKTYNWISNWEIIKR